MKIAKLLIAGLLAASTTANVHAQTTIHIVGSTAFRSATVTAITNILVPTFTYAYTGSSFLGANQQIIDGFTLTNNYHVIIKTSWSGSVSGVQTVAGQIPVTTFLTNTTLPGTGGTGNAPLNYDPGTVPEVCMSDGFQASTPYAYPVLPQLVENTVGIVPFMFLRNTGAPGTLTNLTTQLAQALWSVGELPLALFTGNTNDEGTNVYAIGRDADSGTRLTAFAETGIGVIGSVQQWVPLNGSGVIISRTAAGPIASQELYPAETLNGIFYDTGQGGYSSGGDVAVAIGQSTANIHGFYVSYLGLPDANTAIGLGAQPINWNGVAYSAAAVQQGQYTYWGYEHLDYRSTESDETVISVAQQIAGSIKFVNAPVSGLFLDSMQVSRPIDGGLVTPNY